MNGRIYDPNLGRFLSADPLIQAPYNSQSYNRYSYVMNNPLSLVDPTGYSWVSKKWKKHGRKIVAKLAYGVFGHSKTVRSIMTAGSCIVMPQFCGAAVATNAWVSGAKTSDALKAGARAQVAAYAGEVIAGGVGTATNNGAGGFVNYSLNVAGNGIAGGVASHINGGSFKNGFIASAVGASLKQLNGQLFKGVENRLQRVAFASIAGGAASYLSGGKVGHGMFSAAFTQYWNGERHMEQKESNWAQEAIETGTHALEVLKTWLGISEYSSVRAGAGKALGGGVLGVGASVLTTDAAAAADGYHGEQLRQRLMHAEKEGWITIERQIELQNMINADTRAVDIEVRKIYRREE
jgi:hypothetical protein